MRRSRDIGGKRCPKKQQENKKKWDLLFVFLFWFVLGGEQKGRERGTSYLGVIPGPPTNQPEIIKNKEKNKS
jgi:hypothetical protein